MVVREIKLWKYKAVEYKDCALSDSGLTPDWKNGSKCLKVYIASLCVNGYTCMYTYVNEYFYKYTAKYSSFLCLQDGLLCFPFESVLNMADLYLLKQTFSSPSLM